jgi:hypothetical protein
MKSKTLALAVGAATALASLVPTTAFATGVCYIFDDPRPNVETLDGGPPIVLRYIATKVGPINTDTEARSLNHLRQDAYSIVGKVTAILGRCETGAAVCDSIIEPVDQVRLMTTADGTIITGKRLAGTYPPDEPGAHMGVNVHILRRIQGVADNLPVGPALLECSSSYAATNPPSWRCNLRADVSIPYTWVFPLFEPIVLTRVINPSREPACSVFQDGEPYVPQY